MGYGFPSGLASHQFRWIYQEIERAIGYIDADTVAITDQGDRATIDGFRCHVAHTEARGATREAAISDEHD